MHVPPRIAVPVVTALLLAGGILFVLFSKLEQTRMMLTAALQNDEPVQVSEERRNDIPSLLPLEEDGALLHMRRGDISALRGAWSDAVHAYEQAVQHDGGLPALRKLMQAYLQQNDMRNAQNTLDALRRAGAGNDDLLLWESMLTLRRGEMAAARRLLEEGAASPHRSYGLGLLHVISNQHAEAQRALQEVANGWEPILRSHARSLLNAYQEYALFPDSPDIHLLTLLSRALADAGECELALPMLSRVTREQDDYRDAWMVRGFCEWTTQRTKEALASLEQAYRIDPQKAETQYFLARTYRDLGDHANAMTFLQYALRNGFAPEAEVRELLAEEALQLQQTALALEQWDAVTLLPDASLESFDRCIRAYVESGNIERAREKAQEAAARWPADARARQLLQHIPTSLAPEQ